MNDNKLIVKLLVIMFHALWLVVPAMAFYTIACVMLGVH